MTNSKSNKDKQQKNQQKPKRNVQLIFLGVPRLLYRGSLFLTHKNVKPKKRGIFSKWINGYVNGSLGQMHLDVLEACFFNQLHLKQSDDGYMGIIFDPYQVRKSLNGRIKNDKIFHYIKEIMDCGINLEFFNGKVSIKANEPMIVRMEDHEIIDCPQLKTKRATKVIYFSKWFCELCLIPPYYRFKDVYFDISSPIEKAVKRFLNTHDDFKKHLTPKMVCRELTIPNFKKNITLVTEILKDTF